LETLKKSDYWETPDVDAKMILYVTDLREIECEGVNWIHLVQDMDQW
jgi:hypothetical protein